MEKTRTFQIVYVGRTNLCDLTNRLREIPYETGVSPAATLSHYGQASSRKQSQCGRHGLSNILKLQATFLYSFYHQRAGKTNLFHMRGGRFLPQLVPPAITRATLVSPSPKRCHSIRDKSWGVGWEGSGSDTGRTQGQTPGAHDTGRCRGAPGSGRVVAFHRSKCRSPPD